MEEKKDWREILREKYSEQITAWKRQYGVVKAFFVEDGKGGGCVMFFRIPTRLQLSAAEAVSIASDTGGVDLYKKSERLLADCLLGGDLSLEAILNDTPLFLSVGKFVLYDLVEQKKNELGKLLKRARWEVREGCAVPGSLLYINEQLRYYGICAQPEDLSDEEWLMKYAILEDIRGREKEEMISAGVLNILNGRRV
jgi:hypothetical protein